jgi:hypothetical protein
MTRLGDVAVGGDGLGGIGEPALLLLLPHGGAQPRAQEVGSLAEGHLADG